jgi:hypothetical protein
MNTYLCGNDINNNMLAWIIQFFLCFFLDFSVVAASIVVFTIGSEGQVFATSAIRYITAYEWGSLELL